MTSLKGMIKKRLHYNKYSDRINVFVRPNGSKSYLRRCF